MALDREPLFIDLYYFANCQITDASGQLNGNTDRAFAKLDRCHTAPAAI
jgi:hypothetical protein